MGVGFVLILATCRDGMEPQVHLAPIAVAPVLPSEATLAQFGLTIDHVRFIVVRPQGRAESPDTLADTTVFLAPDLTVLDLDLRVPLIAAAETLQVSVVVLAGTLPLFQGTASVVVTSRTPGTPTEIAVLTYVGPGALVDSIAISPKDPFLFFSDSLRLQVEAFQAGVPLTQFYVSWTTSDTNVARVNGLGVLRAPTSRSSVRVIARTPGAGPAADTITATFQPLPTQLILVTGGGQSGTAGLPLALPLEVEVRAADNLPVGGVAVRFRSLSGLGGVTDSVALTDATGRVRTTATLGSLIGLQTFEARVNGLSGSPATFNATALAGTVTQLLVVAGDGQLAIVNTLLPTAPALRLRDALGNPVAGVNVTFVPAGGGSVTGGNQVTDATGLATVGSWTLGTLAGTSTLTATGAGLTHVFNANGVAGPATALLATAGNLQSAVVGLPVLTAPAVRAQDQFGNPVPGAVITFAVSGGGGSISGPTQLTNAAGIAAVGGWTLGTAAGTNALTATLAGLTPVTFTATGIAGAATQIAQLEGDGQAAIVNTILPTVPAVIVRDQFNNPTPGAAVLFAPASGGGSVTGGSAMSDTAGVARVATWRLGTLVGPNTLTASASGLTGSPVLFSANGTRDVASQLLRVSIDTQTATAGQPVATPPAVRVADQYGNGVPGVSVTFALTGALLGSLTPSVATTDTAGAARVGSWTLATLGGLNTLDATVTGLAGSPMTFSANGIVTLANSITITAGNLQSGVVGAPLPTPYSVEVRDVFGLPVSGAPVNWAVDATGGSMNPVTSLTDANGIATSTRTLGPVANTQTTTASVGGLSTTFTANALPGAAVQLVKQSVDPQTGIVASAVTAPVVKVVDQSGNAVSGVIVNFAVAGGGSLGATQATSDPAGLATTGSWTLGNLVGTNSVTVTAGTVPAVSFTATSVAGPPTRLAFLTEPTRALAGDTIEPAVRVAIQDQYGNLVLSAADVVSLGLGVSPTPGAKLSGTVDVVSAGGVATFPNLAIDSAGIGYTLVANAGARTGAQGVAFDIGGVINAIPVTQLGAVAAALNPQTRKLYVPGSNLLSVLQDDRELLPQLTGFELPFDVAVNAATNQVYLSSLAGVVAIDGAVDRIRLAIPVGNAPKGVAVDEVANRIYVAVGTDPLQRGPGLVPIDGSKDLVTTGDIVLLPAPGMGVAFNPNDGFVYVVIPALQAVDVIDPKPGSARFVHRIEGLGKGTYGVAVDTRANRLYVTNRDDNNVSVIDISAPDPRDFREIARLPVGLRPEALGVDADRGVAYVVNSGASTVSLIDGDKLTVFATLVVGPAPKAAVVDAQTGRVYVPSQIDDLVRVIQP